MNLVFGYAPHSRTRQLPLPKCERQKSQAGSNACGLVPVYAFLGTLSCRLVVAAGDGATFGDSLCGGTSPSREAQGVCGHLWLFPLLTLICIECRRHDFIHRC